MDGSLARRTPGEVAPDQNQTAATEAERYQQRLVERMAGRLRPTKYQEDRFSQGLRLKFVHGAVVRLSKEDLHSTPLEFRVTGSTTLGDGLSMPTALRASCLDLIGWPYWLHSG